jgi:hypothetical protein
MVIMSSSASAREVVRRSGWMHCSIAVVRAVAGGRKQADDALLACTRLRLWPPVRAPTHAARSLYCSRIARRAAMNERMLSPT